MTNRERDERREAASRTRVLVAFEAELRAYTEFIAHALNVMCTEAEVHGVETGRFASEMERLDPHVVICRSAAADSGRTIAWVEIPPSSWEKSAIRLGDEFRESENPSLEELAALIHEAALLAARKRREEGC